MTETFGKFHEMMYLETERPWFFWLLLITSLLALGGYAVWGWSLNRQGWESDGEVILFVVSCILTIVTMAFSTWASNQYFVKTDELGLEFGFNGWSVDFNFTDIAEARAVEISWLKWGGLGWRLRSGQIGYIIRSGSGIQLRLNNTRAMYTFNCRDCDLLLKRLSESGVIVTQVQG